MKNIIICVLISIVIQGCNKNSPENTGYSDQEINYLIKDQLGEFNMKISERAMRREDVRLENELLDFLNKMESFDEGTFKERINNSSLQEYFKTKLLHIYEKAADKKKLGLLKLRLISYYNERLDQDIIKFEKITPYLIPLKNDSTVILFNVKPLGTNPNVFLNQENSAKQLKINTYNPLTINSKNPKWENSNAPIPVGDSVFAVYVMNLNGRDAIFHINKIIK